MFQRIALALSDTFEARSVFDTFSLFLKSLLSVSDFMPHGHCYLWNPAVVWLHVVSDFFIAAAYYSIPILLYSFVRKRRDIPYQRIFYLFAAFIFWCGTTHVFSIVTLWYPLYWVDGLIKAITAVVSVATAILLYPIIPQALALKSPKTLEETNQQLTEEIKKRTQIELELTKQIAESAKLSGMVELAWDAIFLREVSGKIIYWNKGAEKKFGWTKQEAIGNKVQELLRRQDPEGANSQLFETGHWEGELTLYCKNGQPLTVASRWALPNFKKSDSLLILEINSDISAIREARDLLRRANQELEARVEERTHELTLANKQLRKIEDRLELALSAAQMGVWDWNVTTGEFTCSESNLRLFGLMGTNNLSLSRNEYLSRVHPEDLRSVNEATEMCLTGRASDFKVEFRVMLPDGGLRWLYSKGRVFFDPESGKAVRMSGTNLDISERKTTEIRFRRLVDSNVIGIIVTDFSGGIVEANNAFLDLVGFTREEFLKGLVRWDDLTPPEYHGADQAGLEEMRNKGACTPYEKEYFRKDGSRISVLIGFAILENEPGKCICYVVDVTMQKRVEAALRRRTEDLVRSNIELEQFAYVASHDLKEPIRMVKVYAQLLEREWNTSLAEEARTYLNFITEGATRMFSLVNDLLTYSQLGKETRAYGTVNCEEALKKAMANLKLSIAESGAVVRSSRLPEVVGSQTQLVQLFQNLIGNSLKFRGKEQPIVEVSAVEEPGAWKFSVSDNGIGISPEYQDKIFIIFQRLHSREAYPGTGIGLAVCKKIVESHGGSIWLDSEVGKGSTFYFTIPKKAISSKAEIQR